MKLSPQTKILLYAGNLWYFGEGLLGPLFAVFTQRVGGDVLDITGAWAIYMVVSGVLIIIVGKLADKWNKEVMMIAGYALNAILTFGYLFVSTPAQLFALQAAFGVATALATPTWDALYDKYSGSGKNDGFLWGIADGMPNIVVGIATMIGGLIVVRFSFSALFAIMGSIQVVSTVIQAKILFVEEEMK
jgi:MFS family permease